MCISDTHNMHEALTEEISQLRSDSSDTLNVLVHAGDMTNRGSHSELKSIATWLKTEPGVAEFDYKFVISGNMDGIGLDSNYPTFGSNAIDGHKLFNDLDKGVFYLENEPFALNVNDGNKRKVINLYGTPNTLKFVGGFQIYNDEQSNQVWHAVPEGTDVLISHGPPYKILDSSSSGKHVGDEVALKEILERVKPKYMIFGHVHDSFGVEELKDVVFANVAQYNFGERKEVHPFVFDIDLQD